MQKKNVACISQLQSVSLPLELYIFRFHLFLFSDLVWFPIFSNGLFLHYLFHLNFLFNDINILFLKISTVPIVKYLNQSLNLLFRDEFSYLMGLRLPSLFFISMYESNLLFTPLYFGCFPHYSGSDMCFQKSKFV